MPREINRNVSPVIGSTPRSGRAPDDPGRGPINPLVIGGAAPISYSEPVPTADLRGPGDRCRPMRPGRVPLATAETDLTVDGPWDGDDEYAQQPDPSTSAGTPALRAR